MRSICFLFLLLIAPVIDAQVFLKGILNNSFGSMSAGDTVLLCGTYEDPGTQQLYYYLKADDSKVPADKVSLQLDNVEFWEVQQFYYISHKINTNGWDLETRVELEQQTLNLMAKLESERRLYADKYAEDYLQRLVQQIHFPKIWKGRDQNLTVKILDSDQKVFYAFDNGMILISTQLIANAKDEKELFRVLAEAVAHILLDSNLDNIDSDSQSDYGQLGAIYSGSTKKKMQIITGKYLNFYEKKAGDNPYSYEADFLNSIGNIISYTAWQEYYNNHYQTAIGYLDRLMSKDLANSTDYLLKAKIFTKMVNTPEINQQAIVYLKKAASFKDQLMPEIYSDLGVLQLREKQYADARESFLEYQKLVAATKDDQKIKWALKMINVCDVYLKGGNPEAPETQQ